MGWSLKIAVLGNSFTVVGRNKSALAGVSGKSTELMPETVAERPLRLRSGQAYSGLHLTQGPEFRQLLEILVIYATGNVQIILSLPPIELIKSKMDAARYSDPTSN